MRYQIASAVEWLYPDTPAAPPRGATLAAPRGGRAACQILLREVEAGAPLRFRYEVEGGGAREGWPAPEVYQLIDVAVTHNTGPVGFVVKEGESPAGYTTRPAPFRVYDGLRPLAPGDPARGETEALYASWHVPRDARPGEYCGRLVVEVGAQSVSVPLGVEVFPAAVPEAETLAVTNWFNVESMARRHGARPWSEEHWALIERYAQLMRRARQNHFRLPLEVIGISRSDGDQYAFDFSRAERLIRLFLDLGFTTIEGPHVGTRVQFQDAQFVLTADRTIQATSTAGYAFLAQYLPAWRAFLESHGWLGKAIQYVGDEPIDASAQDYRVLSGIVRKFLPGVPLVDAVERPGLAGAVDIWVPKTHYYQEHRADFDLYRRFGDTLWCYTCCFPGGRFANRLLDMPLIRTRLLHWGNYLYDLTGYLHWGFNQYRADQDPFEETAPPHHGGTRLPPGDTNIVYPGPDGPWSSARLEAMAAGIEDYELLRLVQARDAGRADEIVRRAIRAFDDLEEDPQAFESVHRALLQAASA